MDHRMGTVRGVRRSKQRVPLQDTTSSVVNYPSPGQDRQQPVNAKGKYPEQGPLVNVPGYTKGKHPEKDPHHYRPPPQVSGQENRATTAGRYSAAAAYSSSPESPSPGRKTPLSPPLLPRASVDVVEEPVYRNSNVIPSSTPDFVANGTRRSTKPKNQVGPWVLGKTLGKGSHGRVRQARNELTGQIAAVKIIIKHPEGPRRPKGETKRLGVDGAPQDLAKEVVIMKLIDHPNVISLFDVYENEAELYLILEYVDGGEVFEYLRYHVRLQEHEAIYYFRQILSAVEYCQNYGICHRDLKLENILMDINGNIKIGDFGFAALQPKGSLLRTSCGSPHYAAPEVIAGTSHYDGRKSDMWSCGVILYTLLAGRLPFDIDDVSSLCALVVKSKFEMPADISRDAKDLIGRMIVKNPKQRIKIDQIWSHPLISKYAPKDRSGRDLDRGPAPILMSDCPRPVERLEDIERESLGALVTIFPGVREKEIIMRLLNEEPNQEKLLYTLLGKYRSDHLENYQKESADSHPDVAQRPSRRPLSSARQVASSITHHGSQRSRTTRHAPAEPPRAECTSVTRHSAEPASPPAANGRSPHPHYDGRCVEPGWYAPVDYAPASVLQRDASRASLSSCARARRVLQNRRAGSRSSLISASSTSPSVRRVTRVAVGSRRRVSFNHNLRVSNPSLLIGGNTENEKEIHKPEEDIIVIKEEEPSPVLTAQVHVLRGRKYSYRPSRSTVIIDGLPIEKASTPTHLKKYSLTHNAEFQERKRQVSKELEELCNRVFKPSDPDHTKFCSWSNLEAFKIRPQSKPATPVPSVHPSPAQAFDFSCVPTAQNLHPNYQDERPSSPPADLTGPSSPWGTTSQYDFLSKADSLFVGQPPDTQVARQWQAEKGYKNAPAPQSTCSSPGPEQHYAQPDDAVSHDGENTPAESNTVRIVRDASTSSVGQDRLLCQEPSISQPNEIQTHRRVSKPKYEYGLFPRTPSGSDLSSGHPVRARRIEENPRPLPVPDVDSKKVKNKRSLFGIFAGKKPASPGLNKSVRFASGVDGGQSDAAVHDATIAQSKGEPGTKFSLGRWASRSVKKDMAAVEDNVLTNRPEELATIALGDEEVAERSDDDEAFWGDRDEYKLVQSQQNWFRRLLNVKPESRVVCLCLPAATVRRELLKMCTEWKRYGLIVVEDNRKALIVRAQLDASNCLAMKEVSFVVEIRICSGSRRKGTTVARFTQERGAASSFNRVADEIVNVFTRRGHIVRDEKKKARMERVFP